jgi:hypothetical protein
MAGKFAYGGVKEYIFAIGAVIYVLGMFLLLYVYQMNPGSNYTTIPTVSLVSIFGAIGLLFAQLFVAAWKTPNEPQSS